ncbi:MAG: L-2-hydroxyglutarate oxidase [Gaiellaceae bacterium]
MTSGRAADGPAAPTSLPARADAVVVGAGILGLATAVELARRRPDWSVVVLEKEPAPARHQTGRNSCVLHAGVYYAPGSLKAQLCTKGRRLLLDFCAEHEIPCALTGKLVVATDASELPRLDELERRARANGLTGLRLLSGAELREVEPEVSARAGLHVPESGLVDYRLVTAALQRTLEGLGGTVVLDTRVSALMERGRELVAGTDRGALQAQVAVACAGLQSDRLARASGAATGGVTIVPFRGSYFELTPEIASRCRSMIYPVPDPRLPFLGVHVNRRPDGGAWVGPNAVLALAREGYRRRDVDLRDLRDVAASSAFWRLAGRHWRAGVVEVTRDLVPSLVARAVRRFLPEITRADLRDAPAGIRAQALLPDGSLADDFLFAETARVLHVQNAPSPAATSALAIASILADRTIAKVTNSSATSA